jgi:AcrR family transcriptional regulator
MARSRKGTEGDGVDARRRYDSPVRRQQMEATRERIVAAGVELVRGLKTWDWTELTFRAVAERAGVGERTVYRHFPTERVLHAAIMAGLAKEAGVDYGSVTLATVAETAARVFRSFDSLEMRPPLEPPPGPAFVEEDRQRREALLRAVASERAGWSERRRVALAAALDVLWSVEGYELLVDRWGLAPEEATAILGWAIGTLVDSADP